MTALAPHQLRGSYTPLVTPFCESDVDHAAFEGLVERQIAGGSHGIVVTGTTGEPTSLSLRERAELFERAVRTAAGRIPVVAATGSAHHGDTIELTSAAARAGVDAVLVVVPPFVKPSQDGLVRHFTAVAAGTDLPVLIYDIPGRAATGLAAESVARIVEMAGNVVGLKSAGTSLDLVTELLLACGEEFRVFSGVESLSYPVLAVGGAGLMSAVGNLLPQRVARLCDAVAAGDHATALAIHRELFALNQAVFLDTNPVPLKAMLAMEGIASDEVRPPLSPASEDTRARLEAVLAPHRASTVPVPLTR